MLAISVKVQVPMSRRIEGRDMKRMAIQGTPAIVMDDIVGDFCSWLDGKVDHDQEFSGNSFCFPQ